MLGLVDRNGRLLVEGLRVHVGRDGAVKVVCPRCRISRRWRVEPEAPAPAAPEVAD